MRTRGQIYNSGEAAQRYTIPSLQTFYKGLAKSTCRKGCVVWDSGWDWSEKVGTFWKIQNTQVPLQDVYGASEASVEVAKFTQSLP